MENSEENHELHQSVEKSTPPEKPDIQVCSFVFFFFFFLSVSSFRGFKQKLSLRMSEG